MVIKGPTRSYAAKYGYTRSYKGHEVSTPTDLEGVGFIRARCCMIGKRFQGNALFGHHFTGAFINLYVMKSQTAEY